MLSRFMIPSRRPRLMLLLGVALIGGAFLVWRAGTAANGESRENSSPSRTAENLPSDTSARPAFVDLSERQAAAVKTGPVASRDFVVSKTSVGSIDFNENLLVQVSPQYSGKILKAFFNLGDEVKAGDTLFTIDSPDLLQAESTLLASAGVLELQKKTLARTTQLLKTGGGPQKDVDQAISDQQTAEGNFKAAKDAVRIFGKTDAEIDQILIGRKVDSTLIVPSPISGKVVARNAAPGLLSQPGTSPAPYTVANVSTMWMMANVIETDAPDFKIGQEVEVRVPAYPDTVFRGRIETLGSTIDPTTHRQLVRSEIDDPQHRLRSGMLASFVIRVGDVAHSIAVPAEGVVREGDGTNTVWVTQDRRRFFKRTVTTGIREDGWVQIQDGLRPDETVVTDGAVFLSNKFDTGA